MIDFTLGQLEQKWFVAGPVNLWHANTLGPKWHLGELEFC